MDMASCDDKRDIQVLITSVGLNSQFRQQYRVASQLSELPLYDISRPSGWKASQTFHYNNWKQGSLHFEHSNPNDLKLRSSSLKSRVPMPMIVIGLLNYPEFCQKDANSQETLQQFLRMYEAVAVLRIFVFNYTFDQVHKTERSNDHNRISSNKSSPSRIVHPSNENNDSPYSSSSFFSDAARTFQQLTSAVNEVRADPDTLVVIPPEGSACDGGSKVAMHIQMVFSVASARVLEVMALRITRLTATSSYEEASINSALCVGDYFLQACSPLEALQHYASSIEVLRRRVKSVEAIREQHHQSHFYTSSTSTHDLREAESTAASYQHQQYARTLASRLEGLAAAGELVLQLGLFTESFLTATSSNDCHNPFSLKQVLQRSGCDNINNLEYGTNYLVFISSSASIGSGVRPSIGMGTRMLEGIGLRSSSSNGNSYTDTGSGRSSAVVQSAERRLSALVTSALAEAMAIYSQQPPLVASDLSTASTDDNGRCSESTVVADESVAEARCALKLASVLVKDLQSSESDLPYSLSSSIVKESASSTVDMIRSSIDRRRRSYSDAATAATSTDGETLSTTLSEDSSQQRLIVLTRIWELIMRATGATSLTAAQRVTCLVVASQLCTASGSLHRKAALLMYMAGLVSQQGAALSPHVLLRSSMDLYGINSSDSDDNNNNNNNNNKDNVTSHQFTDDDGSSSDTHNSGDQYTSNGKLNDQDNNNRNRDNTSLHRKQRNPYTWMSMRRLLLAHCVYTAREDRNSSTIRVASHVCELLRLMSGAEAWATTHLLPYLQVRLPLVLPSSPLRDAIDKDDASNNNNDDADVPVSVERRLLFDRDDGNDSRHRCDITDTREGSGDITPQADASVPIIKDAITDDNDNCIDILQNSPSTLAPKRLSLSVFKQKQQRNSSSSNHSMESPDHFIPTPASTGVTGRTPPLSTPVKINSSITATPTIPSVYDNTTVSPTKASFRPPQYTPPKCGDIRRHDGSSSNSSSIVNSNKSVSIAPANNSNTDGSSTSSSVFSTPQRILTPLATSAAIIGASTTATGTMRSLLRQSSVGLSVSASAAEQVIKSSSVVGGIGSVTARVSASVTRTPVRSSASDGELASTVAKSHNKTDTKTYGSNGNGSNTSSGVAIDSNRKSSNGGGSSVNSSSDTAAVSMFSSLRLSINNNNANNNSNHNTRRTSDGNGSTSGNSGSSNNTFGLSLLDPLDLFSSASSSSFSATVGGDDSMTHSEEKDAIDMIVSMKNDANSNNASNLKRMTNPTPLPIRSQQKQQVATPDDGNRQLKIQQYQQQQALIMEQLESLVTLLDRLSPALEQQIEGVSVLQDCTRQILYSAYLSQQSRTTASSSHLQLPPLLTPLQLPLTECLVHAETALPLSHRLTANETGIYRQNILCELQNAKVLANAPVIGESVQNDVSNDINNSIVDSATNAPIATSISSAAAPTDGSSLFYDPFAAKRSQLIDRAESDRLAIWCKDSLCTILLRVSNPLSVPLVFTDIQPIFTATSTATDGAKSTTATSSSSSSTNGRSLRQSSNNTMNVAGSSTSNINAVSFQYFTQSVTLPPNAVNHTVRLAVQPLTRGLATITALRLVMHGAERILPLDELGKFIDDSQPIPWGYATGFCKRHLNHTLKMPQKDKQQLSSRKTGTDACCGIHIHASSYPIHVCVIGPRLSFYLSIRSNNNQSTSALMPARSHLNIKNQIDLNSTSHTFKTAALEMTLSEHETQRMTLTWEMINTAASAMTFKVSDDIAVVGDWRVTVTQRLRASDSINVVEQKHVLIPFSGSLSTSSISSSITNASLLNMYPLLKPVSSPTYVCTLLNPDDRHLFYNNSNKNDNTSTNTNSSSTRDSHIFQNGSSGHNPSSAAFNTPMISCVVAVTGMSRLESLKLDLEVVSASDLHYFRDAVIVENDIPIKKSESSSSVTAVAALSTTTTALPNIYFQRCSTMINVTMLPSPSS